MKNFFFQILILMTFYNYSHLSVLPANLPTTFEFLKWLLNTPRVEDVVNDFSFFPTVSTNYLHCYYYVPNSYNETIEISAQNASTVLDGSRNLVIIIHGWLATGHDFWISDMAAEYYRNEKLSVNVVSLDWSEYSDLGYVTDARRVKPLGKVLAEFLQELAKTYPKLFENLHLVGHSLGAHIAGFAGKFLKKSNVLVTRITGLDAAAPLFEYPILQPNSQKLSKDDARYVSLIHTSIMFIGVTLPYGRTDFFVNLGGPIQPECMIPDVFEASLCSHLMAPVYFLRTINAPRRYLGNACKNPDLTILGMPALCNYKEKVPMGEFTPNSAKGVYYVSTNVTGD